MVDWTAMFSDNTRDYQGYAIGKLFQLLDDPDVISLAGGLPSPETFPVEALREASRRSLAAEIEKVMQYSSIPGEKTLVEALIDFLARDGIRVSAENIVITSSGQHGLDLVGRLLLNPGDAVLIDRPTFAGAIVAFQLQRPLFAGVDLESDGSCIETLRERIEALHRQRVRPKFIYVVPDFQNPSGITMSLAKREALLDLSCRFAIPVVEDSPYRMLGYYGRPLPSLYSLDQQRGGENVIGVYTFSKLFCPGMRVGFNIGPASVVQKMTNIKEGNVLNTPKYNQDMCTAYLTDMQPDTHLERCRAHYREKLELLLQEMADAFPAETGVTWTRPAGGLFVWVSLPTGIDTRELFHDALRHKVAFVPGDVFYAENPARNHLRINFSYPSTGELTEGVGRLAACIRNRLGRTEIR